VNRFVIAVSAVVAVSGLPTATAADSTAAPASALKIPALYKNCTNLNKKYPHGLGRAKAVDKTSSGDPVTNFARSTRLFNFAMSQNKGLDRDKDGIACEKA
jgi:hypothetical protein